MAFTRNLKVFVRQGKRYRVVYTAPDKARAEKARNMYDDKITAVHFDPRKGRWLVGVR